MFEHATSLDRVESAPTMRASLRIDVIVLPSDSTDKMIVITARGDIILRVKCSLQLLIEFNFAVEGNIRVFLL